MSQRESACTVLIWLSGASTARDGRRRAGRRVPSADVVLVHLRDTDYTVGRRVLEAGTAPRGGLLGDSAAPGLLRVGLPAPGPPARSSGAALLPEEDDVPLAVYDEALAKQLGSRDETPANGSSGFACAQTELTGLAGFELSNVIHVLPQNCAALSCEGYLTLRIL